METPKNNKSLLKYGLIAVGIIVILILVLPSHHEKKSDSRKIFQENSKENKNDNAAANDSAAESLDTLTAELSTTKKQVEQLTKDNQDYRKQNEALSKGKQDAQDAAISSLSQQVTDLKSQLQSKSNDYLVNTQNASQPISAVPDLTQSSSKLDSRFNGYGNNQNYSNNTPKKSKTIPYYTIPANATAVHDRLMTALVGRIPIKGVVTDPYPFKIVFSDDTLAANGLCVPNLKKMIVSGYSEGDLNLVSARGWVTSLTFVFNDGTISTTTSNNNDIGHFTKENALGYLSDPHGNPFISGFKFITNAPEYIGGNVLLDAGVGFANAFSASQTTSTTNIIGGSTTTVTGSPYKYAGGQAVANSASGVQQWWKDREENSFDAIYVPAGQEVVVNFSKEIDIDYNPKGRKLFYANRSNPYVSRSLD